MCGESKYFIVLETESGSNAKTNFFTIFSKVSFFDADQRSTEAREQQKGSKLTGQYLSIINFC